MATSVSSGAGGTRTSNAVTSKSTSSTSTASKSTSSSGSGTSSSASTSKSTSSGSGSSSSGSKSSYTPQGTYNDAMIKDIDPGGYASIQAAKDAYSAAKARGDSAGMAAAHNQAEAIRSYYDYSGGADGSQYINTNRNNGGVSYGQISSTASSDWDDYERRMNDAQKQTDAAIRAKTQMAVEDLNAQKGKIYDQTMKNNQEAERAYMQAINPNGGLAESLAARGLLPTGLTESSMISAGNAFQNAVNNNATAQTDALAAIEREITKAQLSGDYESASALANLLTQLANKGLENTQNINAINQWIRQNAFNEATTEAGLTGIWNGKPTMAGTRAQEQSIAQQIANQYQQAVTEGQYLQNKSQQQNNLLQQYQLAQLGIA